MTFCTPRKIFPLKHFSGNSKRNTASSSEIVEAILTAFVQSEANHAE